jgi:hypothetical protein
VSFGLMLGLSGMEDLQSPTCTLLVVFLPCWGFQVETLPQAQMLVSSTIGLMLRL